MNELSNYIDSLPVISTHEHHFIWPHKEPATLETILSMSYAAWMGIDCREKSNRKHYLDVVPGNSYYLWVEKALDELFDFGGEITEDNWDSISEKTVPAFANPLFHEELFTERCRFKKAVLDAFWDSGYDNGRPDLYAPALRIDPFLYGSNLEYRDHADKNAQVLYGECGNIDDYVAMIDRVVGEFKSRGCCCLKSGMAYLRALDFKPQDRRAAAKVFGKPSEQVSPEEFLLFGDYIFDQVCEIAAKHELPIQHHTGLGKLPGSNPILLIPMIERHPQTKFVLFHGGYPWIEEIPALSHNYDNVYADLCWLPSIGTSACERLVCSLIETARGSNRITWGGDAGQVVDSYAALIGMRFVLKRTLSGYVESGYMTQRRAMRIAERVLWVNAAELYAIGS